MNQSWNYCLLMGLFFLSGNSFSDLKVDVLASAYSEISLDGIVSVAEISQTLVLDHQSKEFDFYSSTEAQFSASLPQKTQPFLQWNTNTELTREYRPLGTTFGVTFEHLDFASLFENDLIKTDRFELGLSQIVVNKPLVSSFLVVEAQKDVQRRMDEDSESEQYSVSYNSNRIYKSASALGSSLAYTNFFNGVTALDGTLILTNPSRHGEFAFSVGMNRAESDQNDSTLLTGAINWQDTVSSKLNYGFQAARTRSDANSLLLMEGVDSKFETNQLVDTDSLSFVLGWQSLSERLTVELGYQYNWIDTSFRVESIEDVGIREVDNGTVEINYLLNDVTNVNFLNQFSLVGGNLTFFGNLEYRRNLTRYFTFHAVFNSANTEGSDPTLSIGFDYRPYGLAAE